MNLLKEAKAGVMKDALVAYFLDAMKVDKNLFYLDADLVGALGTKQLFKDFPDQCINCGIMEANMVGVAAGMSIRGKIPYTHTFGTFASRRVADQVFISGCYNHANVKMLGSDPGISAEKNGGTHMPFEDIGVLRSFPGMTILDIADTTLLSAVLPQVTGTYGMFYLRFPRKNVMDYYGAGNQFKIGKANVLREGTDVAIIASGLEVHEALVAAEKLRAENISARVVDMFTVKPIDVAEVVACVRCTGAIVTAENHNVIGGLGSAVAEALAENAPCVMERVGVKDQFGEVGDRKYLAGKFQLTSDDIVAACKRVISKKA